MTILSRIHLNLLILRDEIVDAIKELLREKNMLEQLLEPEVKKIRDTMRREKLGDLKEFGSNEEDGQYICNHRTTRNATLFSMGMTSVNYLVEIADGQTLIIVPNRSYLTYARDRISAAAKKPIIHPIAHVMTFDELVRYNNGELSVTFPYGDNYPYRSDTRYSKIFVLNSMTGFLNVGTRKMFENIAKASSRDVIVNLL